MARLADVIDATAELEVLPVAAPSAAELARTLPRLLGVRHISHAQQWKPQATNVYIYSLYRQLFHETYGPEEKLRLEEALLRETGGIGEPQLLEGAQDHPGRRRVRALPRGVRGPAAEGRALPGDGPELLPLPLRVRLREGAVRALPTRTCGSRARRGGPLRLGVREAARGRGREPQRLPRGGGRAAVEHGRALRRQARHALSRRLDVRHPERRARSRRWTSTGARTGPSARRSRRCSPSWSRCARWRSTRSSPRRRRSGRRSTRC